MHSCVCYVHCHHCTIGTMLNNNGGNNGYGLETLRINRPLRYGRYRALNHEILHVFAPYIYAYFYTNLTYTNIQDSPINDLNTPVIVISLGSRFMLYVSKYPSKNISTTHPPIKLITPKAWAARNPSEKIYAFPKIKKDNSFDRMFWTPGYVCSGY